MLKILTSMTRETGRLCCLGVIFVSLSYLGYVLWRDIYQTKARARALEALPSLKLSVVHFKTAFENDKELKLLKSKMESILKNNKKKSNDQDTLINTVHGKEHWPKAMCRVCMQVHPNCSLSIDVQQEMGQFLNDFCFSVITQCLDSQKLDNKGKRKGNGKKGEENIIDVPHVQKALDAVMGGELYKHANSQGNKISTLSNDGQIRKVLPPYGMVYSVDSTMEVVPIVSSALGTPMNITLNAAVYLTAVLEYLSAVIWELSGLAAIAVAKAVAVANEGKKDI